ncbi:MAG: tetratricopeptide repeat protein [Deltaproteobacteria bacterium]|nr:tetratricopeptide repeat protein [Deltaproteobacteria bacterium]
MSNPDLPQLLEDAYSALHQDDFTKARTILDKVRRMDSASVDVVLLEIELLEAEGDEETALTAMEEARSKNPDNVLLAYHHATLLLEVFDDTVTADPILFELMKKYRAGTLTENGILDEELQEFSSGFLLSYSYCSLLDEKTERALELAEEALKVDDTDSEAQLARAAALFDLGRAELAKQSVQKAIADDDTIVEAQWLLGRIELAGGDEEAARTRLAKAITLAPEQFPVPYLTDREEFASLVEDAKAELPGPVADFVARSELVITDLPQKDVWERGVPPGTPIIVVEDEVALFKKNLELEADSPEALAGVIADHLIREVVLFLDLDEDDLLAE